MERYEKVLSKSSIWLYHIEIPIIIYITAGFTVSLNSEIYEKVFTGKDYRKTHKGKSVKLEYLFAP